VVLIYVTEFHVRVGEVRLKLEFFIGYLLTC
jgi:hypothetical protein